MFSYKLPNFIKKINTKNLCVVLTFLYVLSIIPMLVIGIYNWPSVDDFSMALQPHQTFVQTGNFFATVWSAFTKTIYIYNNWVGYFFSSFLTCLSPSIFGERWSALNAVIVIGMLTYGVMYFFDALFRRVWKMEGHMSYGLSMLTLLMVVQSMENGTTRAEAFYWWSGAINYTFMFGLSLAWIGMIFRFIYETDRFSTRRRVLRFVWICVLGFLLGGSNYMTALVMAVCSVLGLFILLMIKLGKFELKGNGNVKGLWVPFVCQLIGLVVSAVAPGNKIRGTAIGNISPIKVVLRSYYSILDVCVNDMMRWEVLLTLVIVAVIAWKMAEGMEYELHHPVVFAFFSFSMMACCVAPPLYAVSNVDAPRIRSTMWMQFLVLLVLTVVYYACWIRQNLQKTVAEEKDRFSLNSSTLLAVIVLFITFGSLLSIFVNPHYYSTTSAMVDLVKGNAKQYLTEKENRMEVFEDDSVKDVVFKPHTVRPELLFQSDMYEDATLWENTIVATYYNKNSVRVSK
ncbi:DUF6056 family protein [Butyrivibrio sp. VCB2001]|uniref:DUF6056 family protein n=1 Tax=Butyrivibrio sp. VCB2001 TaxID=1280667 RepID=UPI00047ECCD7|nr:hypothetical protein [Butyrivibrio sp. VCB2001]